MLADTQQRLREWGQWVRSGGIDNGYNRVQLVAGGSVRSALCNDEDALQVDQAVARLKRRDRLMGRVLVMAYLGQYSREQIAREAGAGSREKVRYLLGGAEAWIDCALTDERII